MAIEAVVKLGYSLSGFDAGAALKAAADGEKFGGIEGWAEISGSIAFCATFGLAIHAKIQDWKAMWEASVTKLVDNLLMTDNMPESGMYTVKKGDSFWSIENEYGLEHGALTEYNSDVRSDQLVPGQNIVLEPDLPVGEQFVEVVSYVLSPYSNNAIVYETNVAAAGITIIEGILVAAGAATLTVAATSGSEAVAGTETAPVIVKRKVQQKFWYATYTKFNSITGEVYVGRASGYGSSGQDVVNLRDRNHHMNKKEPGWSDAIVSTQLLAAKQEGYQLRNSDPSYWAIRGSEQLQIEYYRSMGISGNRINGIRDGHKLRDTYLEYARKLIDWLKY
jgi:LysM repeat protein